MHLDHAWINTILIVALFLITTAIQIVIFSYKLHVLRKMQRDLDHHRRRKTQAVVLLRQRRMELEQTKRFNGN